MGALKMGLHEEISIHALREEGDQSFLFLWGLVGYFYPRPPRGGRPVACIQRIAGEVISIHALREEGDPPPPGTMTTAGRNFYPRPPRGGRPSPEFHTSRVLKNFYPRPPRGGRQDWDF